MSHREVMQKALEALEAWDNAVLLAHDDLVQDRMDSLRTALEQVEPVAFDEFLESQDYYELMQTYRHSPTDAHKPFEAVKKALRAAHSIKEKT